MAEGVPVSYVAQKLDIAYEVAIDHCQGLADDEKIYTDITKTVIRTLFGIKGGLNSTPNIERYIY